MASQAESDSTSQNEGEAEDSSLFSRCVYAKQDSEAVAGKKKRYLHSLHVDMYTKLGYRLAAILEVKFKIYASRHAGWSESLSLHAIFIYTG